METIRITYSNKPRFVVNESEEEILEVHTANSFVRFGSNLAHSSRFDNLLLFCIQKAGLVRRIRDK